MPDPNLEDPQYWERNYQRNEAWLRPGAAGFNTVLSPDQETLFRQWLAANKVPFNPMAGVTDYDMRGFWQAMQRGDPVAKSAINPNDKQIHFPDFWKTPYSPTFSAESQWADPKKAPVWKGHLYQLPNGKVLWNDKTRQWLGPDAPWSASDTELQPNLTVR